MGHETDVQTIGWGGGARWGCKATYSLLTVEGPLDRCRRDLGSVESHRCNWAARKSHLGVSRRSYSLDTPHKWLGNTWPMLGGC